MTLQELLEKIEFVDHPVEIIHYDTDTELFKIHNNSWKMGDIKDLHRKVKHIDVTQYKVLIWVD